MYISHAFRPGVIPADREQTGFSKLLFKGSEFVCRLPVVSTIELDKSNSWKTSENGDWGAVNFLEKTVVTVAAYYFLAIPGITALAALTAASFITRTIMRYNANRLFPVIEGVAPAAKKGGGAKVDEAALQSQVFLTDAQVKAEVRAQIEAYDTQVHVDERNNGWQMKGMYESGVSSEIIRLSNGANIVIGTIGGEDYFDVEKTDADFEQCKGWAEEAYIKGLQTKLQPNSFFLLQGLQPNITKLPYQTHNAQPEHVHFFTPELAYKDVQLSLQRADGLEIEVIEEVISEIQRRFAASDYKEDLEGCVCEMPSEGIEGPLSEILRYVLAVKNNPFEMILNLPSQKEEEVHAFINKTFSEVLADKCKDTCSVKSSSFVKSCSSKFFQGEEGKRRIKAIIRFNHEELKAGRQIFGHCSSSRDRCPAILEGTLTYENDDATDEGYMKAHRFARHRRHVVNDSYALRNFEGEYKTILDSARAIMGEMSSLNGMTITQQLSFGSLVLAIASGSDLDEAEEKAVVEVMKITDIVHSDLADGIKEQLKPLLKQSRLLRAHYFFHEKYVIPVRAAVAEMLKEDKA